MLRFFVPFILGIHIGNSLEIGNNILLMVLVLSIITLLWAHFYLKKSVSRALLLSTSFLLLSNCFVLGALLTNVFNPTISETHLLNAEPSDYLVVRVCSDPADKPRSIGCELEILSGFSDSSKVNVSGIAQAYFQKDSLSSAISYGDILVVSNKFKEVEDIKNPHQFDFKKYYKNKNIYHQGYFKSNSWIFTGKSEANPILRLSFEYRAELKSTFSAYFDNRAIKGVAEAIVFGYKEDLDEDWLKAFSKTGTIHVLAVSGLHVGIIFVLLSSLLGLGRSKGSGLIIKSILIVLFLFAYSMLTGFSPSVSRASLMFSVVIMGKAFNRNSSIYNTLTFAAFILVLINPLNIYNVGFQFSFLAVIGIVYYKDMFRNWFPRLSWLGDKVITLLSVSLAAQITTFPLGLYYFHQYPNLFMISNLVVIPCISVILYTGIFFVISSKISVVVSVYLARIMEVYIQFISDVVHYIQNIPYAFFENVHITLGQMLSIYGFIILLTVTRKLKWKYARWLMIVPVLSFVLCDQYYEKSLQGSEVICFDVRNETLVAFRSGKQITFLASKGVYLDQSKLDFILKPYLIKQRIKDSYQIFPISCLSYARDVGEFKSLGNGFVWFQNKSIVFIDQLSMPIVDSVAVDYAFIGKQKNSRFLKNELASLEVSNFIVMNNWRVTHKNYDLSGVDSVVFQNGFLRIQCQ